MRISSPSWWAFADSPVSNGFTDGFSAAGVAQGTWILTLVLNASKLVTGAIWVMLTFTLRDCK